MSGTPTLPDARIIPKAAAATTPAFRLELFIMFTLISI
jgi:hypothetical protein